MIIGEGKNRIHVMDPHCIHDEIQKLWRESGSTMRVHDFSQRVHSIFFEWFFKDMITVMREEEDIQAMVLDEILERLEAFEKNSQQ